MSKEKSLNEPKTRHTAGFKMKKVDKIITKGIKRLVKSFNEATISGLRSIEKDTRKPKNESKPEKKRGNKVLKMRK